MAKSANFSFGIGSTLLHRRLRARGSAFAGFAAETKDFPSLRGSCYLSVELMRDACAALDQLGVALGFAATGVVDVVFEADAHVASHESGQSGKGELGDA